MLVILVQYALRKMYFYLYANLENSSWASNDTNIVVTICNILTKLWIIFCFPNIIIFDPHNFF